MGEPIYQCWCKATRREDSEPRYSHNWITAKRARFKIFEDRVQCGSWSIPFAEIDKAIVYQGKQMFIPVKVLHLITADGSYQFGFNPWATPTTHLNLPLDEQRVRFGYSPFSIAVRVVLVILLATWVWDNWIAN